MKILILNSGRFFAVLNNSYISAGTLVLLVYIVACKPRCLGATRLMFCRICYPAVSNIRICDPRLIPINQKIGSKRIEKSLYSIPADYKSAGTLVLLVYIVACKPRCLGATRLLFCRICYPAAKNIRIFDPRLIPINQKIGSKRIKKILILYSGRLQISRHISLVAT